MTPQQFIEIIDGQDVDDLKWLVRLAEIYVDEDFLLDDDENEEGLTQKQFRDGIKDIKKLIKRIEKVHKTAGYSISKRLVRKVLNESGYLKRKKGGN